MVANSIRMEERVVPLVSVDISLCEIGELFTKYAMLHVSVRQINYNLSSHYYKFIMRYNELTYHKASPFYKQDYLPDRAWYNRKPKEFPSQIPTGQDYFTDNGRKHFYQRFNHSQIATDSILQSPERYPFENRIAQDKTYMRNLDTIDIEGAASGTRVNQSIKNKMKAQEELARRNNQAFDIRENRDKTYEVKRRQIAQKQYQTLQDRKAKQIEAEVLESSRINQITERSRAQEDTNPENYQPYYANSNTYGKKYISLLPKPYYANIQHKNNEPKILNEDTYTQKSQDNGNYDRYYQPQPIAQQNYEPENQLRKYQEQLQKQGDPQHLMPTNNRHKSNPEYYNAYDAEWNRRRQEYVKNNEIDEISRNKLQDKREFRKHNPTNLSFNLAAQSIVGNNR